jgi:hypothetical protein
MGQILFSDLFFITPTEVSRNLVRLSGGKIGNHIYKYTDFSWCMFHWEIGQLKLARIICNKAFELAVTYTYWGENTVLLQVATLYISIFISHEEI